MKSIIHFFIFYFIGTYYFCALIALPSSDASASF